MPMQLCTMANINSWRQIGWRFKANGTSKLHSYHLNYICTSKLSRTPLLPVVGGTVGTELSWCLGKTKDSGWMVHVTTFGKKKHKWFELSSELEFAGNMVLLLFEKKKSTAYSCHIASWQVKRRAMIGAFGIDCVRRRKRFIGFFFMFWFRVF
jgi:hypothetical protein